LLPRFVLFEVQKFVQVESSSTITIDPTGSTTPIQVNGCLILKGVNVILPYEGFLNETSGTVNSGEHVIAIANFTCIQGSPSPPLCYFISGNLFL